jgi:hypothetical protein
VLFTASSGLGRGKVGKSDLAEDAEARLIPIGKRALAGDHLLRIQRCVKKSGGYRKYEGQWVSHC